MTRVHLAERDEEHLSGNSVNHEHISSCKKSHSYPIINFNCLAQVNADFSAKMKDALSINVIHQY